MTTRTDTTEIALGTAGYPSRLAARLDSAAPPAISTVGNAHLLQTLKTALFCSTRCPGDPILAACGQAAQWRDEGRCIISGFHSPVEKECLRILLAGNQPIIICPARSLEGMRIPVAWRDGVAQGRILLLSPFQPVARRQSAALARQRNEFVAALADDIYIPYASPGGSLGKLLDRAQHWSIPITFPDTQVSQR
ncbi:MAG: DNA-binding protein [Candidatus Hydrogenedentes bacterium]|nr:DNA-binding protein [Candidatus Hydrogenedentota bacterium]